MSVALWPAIRLRQGITMSIDLSSLGWHDDFARAYRSYDRPDHQPGRVARVDLGVCTVLCPTGPVRASLSATMLDRGARDPVDLPCTGDWVAVRTWPDGRVTVETVLPRRTAVIRASAGAEALGQALAANIDTAAVVEPMDPQPDPGRIERLLALAWDSGARPVVVLTKADLVRDPATVAAAITAPDVSVYAVSTRSASGLSQLRRYVTPGRTLGLLGSSGAGKSSLVNALVGTTVMGVQDLRSDGRGRHTTTVRALVPVPDGGAVLDTPGIRGIGMFDGTAGLALAFGDITALAARCRFVGCAHDTEPGCEVRAALATGELSPRRLASWHKLQRELLFETNRREARHRSVDQYIRRRAERRARRHP